MNQARQLTEYSIHQTLPFFNLSSFVGQPDLTVYSVKGVVFYINFTVLIDHNYFMTSFRSLAHGYPYWESINGKIHAFFVTFIFF